MANNINFGRAWYQPGPITLGTPWSTPVGAYIDKTTGQLYMWSDSNDGADKTRDIFNLPKLDNDSNAFIQPVEEFDNVKMISLEQLGVILKNDGEAYIWSRTEYEGHTALQEAPQRVAGDDYIYASSAQDHVALIKEDGTVWSLGLNPRGAFGTGTTSSTFTNGPVQMLDMTDVAKVAAFGKGSGPQPAHYDSGTLILKKDGTVWVAGSAGKLTPKQPNTTATQVPSLSGIVDIAVGNDHAIVLDERGDVYTWGDKRYLGQGFSSTTQRQYTPAQVSFPIGASPFVAIKSSPTSNNTYALAEDGTLWFWELQRPMALTIRVADVCTTATRFSYLIRDNSFPDGQRLYYATRGGHRISRYASLNPLVSNMSVGFENWLESLPGAEGIDFPMDFSDLTGAPSSGSDSGQSKADVILKATAVWFDTGVDVKAGDKLSITASGGWKNNVESEFAVGPDGFDLQGFMPLPTANLASLIGRIGTEGELFFVGGSFSEVRSDAGRLFLQMNDDALFDNAGQLEVSIEAG